MKAEDIIERHYKALMEDNPEANQEMWEIAQVAAKQTIICLIDELTDIEFNYDLEDRFKDVCLSKTVIPSLESQLKKVDQIKLKTSEKTVTNN